MIEHILISSDFLMTKEKEQASNRRWILDLLRRPLELVTGITPVSFGSSLSQSDALSRTEFFGRSQIDVDVEATHFWFDDALLNDASLEYLSGFLNPRTLVIGYELSPQTRRVLDRMGVQWIDMWLHPIRFLDDILFGFSSSDAQVFGAMSQYHVKESVIQLYADRLRIQYYKGYKRPDLPIRVDSALFIGQTLEDKAVCDRGRMLNLLDFRGAFERAGQEYGTVYFSRHPYVKTGDEEILKYVRRCGFAKIVDWPAYHALASGRLGKVFSISSSVVHEAKYFGMETGFLYKPVISYGTDRSSDEYLSIYQEFVSPHFWSEALAPLMSTQACERIAFLEPKDKLRDMLNFYWSYRHVDKQEDARQTLLVLDRKIQMGLKAPLKKPVLRRPAVAQVQAPAQDWAAVEAEALTLMNAVDLVSFDLFDTLIERPLEHPADLFDMITPEARRITQAANLDFRSLRLHARALVEPNPDSEEVPLAARYQAIAAKLGLPASSGEELLHLEEAEELRICRPRPAGKALYEAALRMNKRVVITSDTFFRTEVIEALLTKNGYAGHEQVFTSLEVGKLKQTGNMFPTLLEACAVAPQRVLHIGDNATADIRMAGEAGLRTFHLPKSSDTFAAQCLLSKQYQGGCPTARSLVRGLSANALCGHSRAIPAPSFVGNDPRKFGYAVAGPMFFGFAKWVLEKAIADQVDTLYFLARDGEIVLRCYEQLAAHYPAAPRARYLRASRRGLNVAALETEADVLALLQANFTPCSIGRLLKNRFGLEATPSQALEEFGYSGPEDMADWRKDKERLQALLTRLAPAILENAATERSLLARYYEQQGLLDPGSKAVVDIGHTGSLQASLSRLCDQASLGGYYFVTERAVDRNLLSKGLPCRAYFAERLEKTRNPHTYFRYILMFEAMFLNDEGTFIRMRESAGELVPELGSTESEYGRIQWIRQVHEAAVAFTRDIADVLRHRVADVRWDASAAVSGYVALLGHPTREDARLFAGIGFENAYSGRDERMLIDLVAGDRLASEARSIWKEGARALLDQEPVRTANWRSVRLQIVGAILRRTTSPRKYAKFLRSPQEFFFDSRVPLLKHLGRVIT